MLDGFSAVTYALCKKYTNGAIQQVVESFSEGMHFQGSVATRDDLPDNPEKGDLYIIRDTGTKVVYDGEQWVEFEQNFYTKEEVDAKIRELESEIPDISGLATKQSLTDEINRAKARENSIANSIPTKTSQLINDSGFLTEHQDISGKADKSYVDSKLALKQNKLTAGENITINGNVISAVVPSLSGYATEQWVENQGYLTEHQSLDNYYTKDEVYDADEVDDLLDEKQHVLTAGNNITIVDNVISAAGGGSSGTMGRSFTTDVTVGHLLSGTRINADDLVSDVLYRMLYAVVPEAVSLFYGALDELPTDVSDLTEIPNQDRGTLLSEGKIITVIADEGEDEEGQWVVFAVPRTSGIKVSKVHNEGMPMFDVPITTYETPTHYIATYLNTKQYNSYRNPPGAGFILDFEEI